MTKNKVGERHYNLEKTVKQFIKRSIELEDIISILGFEELSIEDQQTFIVSEQLKNYFSQNFFVAEPFTQAKGIFVEIEQTLNDVERILSKEFIEIEPMNFRYINKLEDVYEK